MAFLSNPRTTLGLGGFSSPDLTWIAEESGSSTDSIIPVLVEEAALGGTYSKDRTDTISLILLEVMDFLPSGGITELQLSATPGVVRTFEAKSEVSLFTKIRTDTAYLQAQEEPFDEQTIEGWDAQRLRTTETWAKTTGASVPRVDSIIPILYESASVSKSQTTTKNQADTASLVLTEVSTAPVPKSVLATDTASLSLSYAKTIDVSTVVYTATDTVSLSVDEQTEVTIAQVVNRFSQDVSALTLVEVGTAGVETLYRRVEIDLTWPTWTMSIRLR